MDAGPAHLIPSAGASRLQPAAAGPGSVAAAPPPLTPAAGAPRPRPAAAGPAALRATPAGAEMPPPPAATAAATAAADIHYRVQALDVDAHLFSVQLHIARPAAGQ